MSAAKLVLIGLVLFKSLSHSTASLLFHYNAQHSSQQNFNKEDWRSLIPFDTLLKSLKKPANVLSWSVERRAPAPFFMFTCGKVQMLKFTTKTRPSGRLGRGGGGFPLEFWRYHPQKWNHFKIMLRKMPAEASPACERLASLAAGMSPVTYYLLQPERPSIIYQTSRVFQASYLILVDEEEHDEQNLQEEDKQEQDEELSDTKEGKFNMVFI